jgi:tyrosinase
MPNSSIWDPVRGFGGNGSRNTTEGDLHCVTDGPFASLRPSYWELEDKPHCLSRDFNNGTHWPGNMRSPSYTRDFVQFVHDMPDYDQFRWLLEGGPHGSIHAAVGGDLDPSSSPNGKSNSNVLLENISGWRGVVRSGDG